MDLLSDYMTLLNLIFRWTHVVAGVMWIGHLWFFNFVNSQVAKTYDAPSKKAVVPQLMPRALYWFRWGAAYTWITGVLLLGVVIYMGGALDSKIGNGAGMGVGLGALVVGFLIYDVMWKSPLAKNEMVAGAISYALVVAATFGFSRIFGGRATWIHLGALFGTIMAANVWMRIWPNQKKLIAAAAGGPAADPSVAALAGLRSKHNTYMSVPLMLTMVSNHYPTWFADDEGWLVLSIMVALGWGGVKLMYSKSAQAAPSQYT
ncbi:MAG TPA: urate hydroxylase PuuD [Myxococcales bacterium]|nr:urate hydroxylase PuuD [Myxococcales bacterium]